MNELLQFNNRILKEKDRLEYFISLGTKEFTRKDYMNIFKTISSATASRDLLSSVEDGVLKKIGLKNQTIYQFVWE